MHLLWELTFRLKPFSFKHTGLFPEQAVNWDWFEKAGIFRQDLRCQAQEGEDAFFYFPDLAFGTPAIPAALPGAGQVLYSDQISI